MKALVITKKKKKNEIIKIIFPCYSIPMRDFFTLKGIRYELVGLHPKSHKMFWVYIKSNELEKVMNEWSLNNR